MIAALALVAALAAVPATALSAPPIIAPAMASAPDRCVAESGAFTWGFKESFRAYISGSIANGEWSTDGDINYATPAFFSDALGGSVALDSLAGEVAVDGSLRFTGHEGILDTTISDLRFVLESAERLSVVVDVRGTTQDFVPIDSVDVPFLSGDLNAAEWSDDGDGTVTIDGIPLVLTPEGAEAFGTYPAGEAFDPLTLELSTSPDCAAQALEARAAGGAVPLLVVAGVVAGGVGLGAVLALLLRRRRGTMAG